MGRPPGKTGLSYDVILNRLQGEVQKSRETGAELMGLTTAMGDVGDILGGGGVSNYYYYALTSFTDFYGGF